MTERPILFTAEMVRAVLDGSKTQTRRVVKTVELRHGHVGVRIPRTRTVVVLHPEHGLTWRPHGGSSDAPYPYPERCYGAEQHWVRETWRVMRLRSGARQIQIQWEASNTRRWVDACDTDSRTAGEWIVHLQASEERAMRTRRASIHMPRWASRIQLEVTEVRIERAMSISHDDILAEGVRCPEHDAMRPAAAVAQESLCKSECASLRAAWVKLWDGINKGRGFGSLVDPWVWAVSFGVIDAV